MYSKNATKSITWICRGAHDGLDRDFSKSEVQSALRVGFDEPCSTKCCTNVVDEPVRANDFRFFPAFGGCRAQQRTTPIYATALRRTFLAHQNFVLRGPSARVRDLPRDSSRSTSQTAKYPSGSSPSAARPRPGGRGREPAVRSPRN